MSNSNKLVSRVVLICGIALWVASCIVMCVWVAGYANMFTDQTGFGAINFAADYITKGFSYYGGILGSCLGIGGLIVCLISAIIGQSHTLLKVGFGLGTGASFFVLFATLVLNAALNQSIASLGYGNAGSGAAAGSVLLYALACILSIPAIVLIIVGAVKTANRNRAAANV